MRLICLVLLPLPAFAADTLKFSRDIRPILSENCFACHGPDDKKREAGLRLDDEAGAKANNDGVIAIVPGHPETSALIQRIESTDPDEVMPPPKLHKTIPPAQVTLLKQWIKEGAPWGKHWSYEMVVRPEVPVSKDEGGRMKDETNAIDAFLAQRLRKEGLAFSPEADAATLVRRLALDLTGLPPTLEELERFTSSPELLASSLQHYLSKPAFGEHWARTWLDLARYADSSGYPSDQPREIWAYRDWVIKALNANMPFDQFTIEQLAGDLLPKPSNDQLTATAFHRNTMTQNEGGTSDEEYRVAAIIDRVNTTMAVWMGTSMACAQCHTHKYDPITITEYFQFYALLNQSADADKKDESPLLELWKPGQKEQRAKLEAEIKQVEAAFAKPKPEWLKGLDAWASMAHPELDKFNPKPTAVIAALALPKDQRTPPQQGEIQAHYVRHIAPEAKLERDQLAKLNQQLAALKPDTVPVMKELADKARRITHVQLRGNWQALDAVVQGGTPSVFPPLPKDKPVDRLTMAQWLVSRNNPLTARVMVNRLWEQLFGIGLVRTSEEFGSQGELPFHPELLDWLAAEFMESGWDVKHMLTLMVSSRAYRQSSANRKVRSAQLSVRSDDNTEHSALSTEHLLTDLDPDNRLLARGPRFRPTGEMLRDQALAVSGLLSPKMYGPGVRPPTPNLGLSTAFGRSNDWTVSTGEDKYRRSVYTEVRRNSPYASYSTFDAPNREVCTLRRGRTNTPLQAFVTLNDPVFIEASQALARRVLIEQAGKSTADQMQWLFKLCLSRAPTAPEQQRLLALLTDAQRTYQTDNAKALKLATDPLGPLPPTLKAPDLAAWTTVANVVINLDEFVMRR